MPEAMHEVVLSGCTPEPLMNYLKALGILRLVAEDREHGDPNVRGFWRNDLFVLHSHLDEQGIEDFFLKHYRPTPIVAPWAGGSGFFKKDNKEAVEKLLKSSVDRIAGYREAIGLVQKIIGDENIGEKPKDDDKVRLIQRYRRELADDVVSWMDAAMVLQQDGQAFAPILGTGGNDGRLDFTQNFMQRLVLLHLHENEPDDDSRAWIRQSFFAASARLNTASVGQFAPGRAGGPNATQGMEGDSADNPWDFVLMMEGALVLAGAAVRRLGVSGSGRAAFPFTVRAADVGFASAGRAESSASRGELWMPLWKRPSSLAEIATLFSEGRAEVNGRPARDAVGFARAAATLGVDRGIAEFSRVSLLKRSGKAFLATPAGRIAVTDRRDADLLRQIDSWLDSFRRACSSDNVPARFIAALRAIEAAIFDFCRYGTTHFQSILTALGAAERELANAERFRDEKKLKPLAGLPSKWIDAARSSDHVFEIALALAGVHHAPNRRNEQPKYGPIRANLESVNWQKGCRSWADGGRAVVWNAADLPTNLAAVLTRRIMDGERHGCENLPLAAASQCGASPAAIEAFLRGDLDERRIEALIWGLMCVDSHRLQSTAGGSAQADAASLPLIYCLFKLLFLPCDLVAVTDRDGQDKPSWRLARLDEDGTHRVRPEARVLSLLRSDRVGDAAAIAMRRLWVSGLALWCSHTHHTRSCQITRRLCDSGDESCSCLHHTRDCQIMRRLWASGKMLEHHAFAPGEGHRLAAALLIPVRDDFVNAIVQRATKLENWVDAIS